MDKPNENFAIIIVSPDKVVLEGQAKKLIVPSVNQDLAILPDHTPLYAEVIKGDLVVTLTDNHEEKIAVEGGIMRVKQNKVSIILGFK